MVARHVICACLVQALLLGHVHADATESAKALIKELKYKEAKESLDKALKQGSLSGEDLANLYFLHGQVSAILGETEDAQSSFGIALLIDPELTLPKGSSPKLTEPFEYAKEQAGNGLKATAKRNRYTVTVSLRGQVDWLDSIKVTWNTADGEDSFKRQAAPLVSFELPEEAISFTVSGHDLFGNMVFDLPQQQIPVSVSEVKDPPIAPGKTDDESEGTPIYRHWALWGGVTVAFAGAGLGMGYLAQNSQSELDAMINNSQLHQASEALALEDQAKSRARLANFAYGAAGVCAVATGIFWFVGRNDGKEKAEEPGDISFVPSVAGWGVAANWAF